MNADRYIGNKYICIIFIQPTTIELTRTKKSVREIRTDSFRGNKPYTYVSREIFVDIAWKQG